MTKMKTLALAAVTFAGLSMPAFAQDIQEETVAVASAGQFTLELNTVAQTDGSCRLTYVATNETEDDLRNAAYEVAVFDDRGAVSKLLILEFGALDTGRTRVVQFDIDGQTCDGISKILVNNQVDCATSEGESNVCMANLNATTLDTNIVFTD
jgi:hypothetical protein